MDHKIRRRSFFGVLLGIGSAGIGAMLAVPVLRYVLYPIYAKATGAEWSDVGDASEFDGSEEPVRKTMTFRQRDGWREVVSAQSVYVSRAADGQLEVLSAICPHLGCSVSWPARTNLCAPAVVASSKPTGNASPGRRHGLWIVFPCKSRMEGCRFTSSISVPVCQTGSC